MKKRSIGIFLIVIGLVLFGFEVYRITDTNNSSEWILDSNDHESYGITYYLDDFFNEKNIEVWEKVIKDYNNKKRIGEISMYVNHNISNKVFRCGIWETEHPGYRNNLSFILEEKMADNEKGYVPQKTSMFIIDKKSVICLETKFFNGYKAKYIYNLRNYKGESVYSSDEVNSPFCDSLELEPGLYYEDLRITKETNQVSQKAYMSSEIFVKAK